MHSYTQSLRYQLKPSSIQVIEIIPPWVQTELQGNRGLNLKAMPLNDYIAETIASLTKEPDATEIISERATMLRFAERDDYDVLFSRYNEGWLTTQER